MANITTTHVRNLWNSAVGSVLVDTGTIQLTTRVAARSARQKIVAYRIDLKEFYPTATTLTTGQQTTYMNIINANIARG